MSSDDEYVVSGSPENVRLFSMVTSEIAESAGISERRVRQLIAEGRLNAVKLGGVWIIDRESFWRWLRTRRGPGRPSKDERPETGKQLRLLGDEG